jgi:ABC-type bacteriocin/lantibiotic exporter with double-glycine peptidase domain
MNRLRPILQMEVTECGAASLAMVLAAHGRFVSLEEARTACGVSRDGVDLASLMAAASTFGMKVKALRREPETLGDLPLPAILHWRFDHFLVLEKIGRRGFTLLDPAEGRRVVDAEEMNRSFTGMVLALLPNDGFVSGGRPPSLFASLVRRVHGSTDAIAMVFVAGVLGLIPSLALAGAIRIFTDHVIGQSRIDWTTLVLAGLLVATLAQGALAGLQAWVVANLKAKIGIVVAALGFRQLLRLPLAFFSQRSAGELVSRLRIGSEIGSTIAGPLASFAPNIVTLLGLLLIITLHEASIGAFIAAISLICLIVLQFLGQHIADTNRAQHVLDARAIGIATSGFASFEAFRLLGREDLFSRRWMQAEEDALGAEQRLGVMRAGAALGPIAAPLLLTVAVLLLGADKVMDGDMSLGSLLALQVLAGLTAKPLAGLARDLCDLQEAAGALTRLDDLDGYPLDIRSGETAHTRRPAIADAPVVEIADVAFAYGPNPPVFEKLSVTLDSGTLVALTGVSGAGKSTLARIVAGLVPPSTGMVRIKGIDLAAWPSKELRQALAYVPQTSAVFSGTLAENVTLFDPSIDDAAIIEALEISGIGYLVQRPGGLGYRIAAESPSLSGGEVQRLALARALVRKPAVVILDETTSALDPITEAQILDALRQTESCVLCVTHRPGTKARCDRVLQLDGRGGIVDAAPPSAVESLQRLAGA